MGAIAAAVLPTVISVGANLIGGSSSKSAANDQANAAGQGISTIQANQQQTRSDLMPWMTAGTSAVGGLSDLLGLNGAAAQQAAITGQQNSPLFQSLFRQGNNTILADAAATGGLRGGNTENSLANFGSDLLAKVIQQQIGNLTGVSNSGLSAANSEGAYGGDAAVSIANLLGQQGAARAGGAMANGQMWSNALQGIGGMFGSGGPLSGIFGGGSSPLDLTGLVPAFPDSSIPTITGISGF